MKNIEIAIIGAGPAGLSAAMELSKLGHKDIIVFDRENEAGGTPRHCGHLGFGMFEFKRVLSGPNYAKRLAKNAQEQNIEIKLKSTLIKIDKNILTFSTPAGIQQYNAKKVILALGARETPRPSHLVSGTRSPNIITTGAFQRFVYMQKTKPFKKAIIIGSEVVSFSALMTARHADIKIEAMLEENENINSYGIFKYLTKLILGTPVKTGIKILSIEGKDKNIEGIRISKDGVEEFIECDGVIFSGDFTPESAIMQTSFDTFNHTNNSLHVTQNFQTYNEDFFVVGNALRGALAGYKCYFEGKSVAQSVHQALSENENPKYIEIHADENIQWYSPSLIDTNALKKSLTTLRLKKNVKGVLKVLQNDAVVFEKEINGSSYKSIDIPWINGLDLKSTDNLKITFS